MTKRSKRWLAAFLIGTWVILAVIRIVDEPDPERVPLRFKSGLAQELTGKPSQESDNSFTVRHARSKAYELPHVPSHNIFAPLDTPGQEAADHQVKKRTASNPVKSPQPPSPAPVVVASPPPPSEEELAAQRAIRDTELSRQEAMRELSAFRFLGFIERDGVAQAFLARGNELYVVANGDTVDDRYVVTVLDTSSVRILATRTGVETTIGKSNRASVP